MSAFNSASLPVAPEFVQTLREQVADTIIQCLKKLGAPNEVIFLVNDLQNLGDYSTAMLYHPEKLTGDFPNFDIANTVIETINDIAAVGGTFEWSTASIPRAGSLLAEVVEAEKVAVKK